MKATLKKAIKWAFRLLVLPLYLWFEVLSKVFNEDSIFQSFSQYLSLIPGKLGSYCRAAFYWWACTNTSDEVSIGFLTIFSHRDMTIERGVYIGPQCNIGKCHIAENTLLGSGVHVLSGNKQHLISDLNIPVKDQGGIYEKIKIGTDCWIGNQATIISSVQDKSVVASASVVTKSFLPYSILAGNPACVIKSREPSTEGGN